MCYYERTNRFSRLAMYITEDQIIQFQEKIIDFYNQHGRQFAWRLTQDPYHILVSEFMLQQTQTNRVEPKYEQFLQKFPTLQDCARSPLSDVLTMWQGLGYNRRAKYLHETAKVLVESHEGIISQDASELCNLPGIGPYTAAAVCTFSYNKPFVFIETNIRTVFIDEFFRDQDNVHDRNILSLIDATLLKNNPRIWYYALMDYGACLKKMGNNVSTQSVHYNKQSKFEGSNRQLRGMIIKMLTQQISINRHDIEMLLDRKDHRIAFVLESLIRDGLVQSDGDHIRIKNE